MNKGEFLEGLRERLAGEIPEHEVREHLRYYDQYLEEQIQKGKTEEEAVEMLGSPYLIAKTILDMEEQETEQETRTVDEDGEQSSFEQEYYSYNGERTVKNHKKGGVQVQPWYTKLLFFVVILLIVILVFTIIGSLMAFVIRFLFPILVIMLLVHLLKKGKGGA